jgi:hypothetical protein
MIHVTSTMPTMRSLQLQLPCNARPIYLVHQPTSSASMSQTGGIAVTYSATASLSRMALFTPPPDEFLDTTIRLVTHGQQALTGRAAPRTNGPNERSKVPFLSSSSRSTCTYSYINHVGVRAKSKNLSRYTP